MQQTLRPNFKFMPHRLCLAAAVFFCSLILFPGSAFAQDVLESLEFDSKWPQAAPDTLALADGTLFVAAGNVLVLLDSETFQERSRISLDAPRGIQGIAVNLAEDPQNADVVYAACGSGGLQVVDISDRDFPALGPSLAEDTDSNAINATALDMGPTGNYLYLADYFFGMHVIEVSTAENPSYRTGYEQTSSYTDEEDDPSSGGYINICTRETGGRHLAFILDRFLGLRILDISNNSTIEELAQFDMRSDVYFGQASGVVDVTANGNYAFVSDSAFGIAILNYYTGQEVKIDKDAVGQIEAPGRAFGLALSGDEDNLFLADRDTGLLVADVSDPYPDYETNPDHPPERVNEASYAAAGAYAVLESGEDVFLANAQNGLAKLEEAGSSLDYQETGAFFDPPAAATSIVVKEEYAYVLDNALPNNPDSEEGLRILKLRDEETGVSSLAGFVVTPGKASATAVHENFAWIADGTEGVACVDIADPESANISSTFTTTDARDIKVREYDNDSVYAFIADDSEGLIIAEADSQGWFISPTVIPISSARAVALYEEMNDEGEVAARYALVANGTGMTVVDVTDPTQPVEKGSLDTSANDGQALDVATKPPYAVLAHGEGGVLLVDLSAPDNPEIIDSFDAEGRAEAVFIHQSYVHTAVGERGLLVLGISDTDPAKLDVIDIDPNEDRESPYSNTPGYAADVAVAGENNRFTYVADTHGGFRALLHSDRIGGGINEQPFEESSDDTGCFIEALGVRY